MKKIKRDRLLWLAIILILGLFMYFGLERYASILKKEDLEEAKKIEKIEKKRNTINNLQSSKLFGIKLGDSPISLLFQLKNLASSYGNLDKITEPSGLLKGTKFNFFTAGNFTVLLNDYIDDEGMQSQVEYCEDLYDKIGKQKNEYSCLKPIQKNKDFSKYYIKYHPYGDMKISSIFASLNKEYKNFNSCVKDLRPYVNVIVKRIKKDNPDKNIIIEDNFYPTENGKWNFPQVIFKYKGDETYHDDIWVLTIKGYCNDPIHKESFIEIEVPAFVPNYKVWSKVMKELSDKKELDLKNDFNKNASDKEFKIEKKGL